MRLRSLAPVLAAALLLAACGTPSGTKKKAEPSKPADQAPAEFKVKFETSKGEFVVHVHRDWAPRGADRFYELVKSGFYDDSRFFRVIKEYVAQFGLAKDPKLSQLYAKSQIADDPVMKSNMKGRVSFAKAGPSSRTSQVFISLRNNRALDEQGFAPFGEVISGMESVEKLHYGYGDYGGIDQSRILAEGNQYLDRNFSRLDKLVKATIVEEGASSSSTPAKP
ncbi:MAG TPA: peptidylprolyl isomerase [Solibacterales bacterium]|nr:peptidylprolyl isomerase [Bryobacterales bacterium]